MRFVNFWFCYQLYFIHMLSMYMAIFTDPLSLCRIVRFLGTVPDRECAGICALNDLLVSSELPRGLWEGVLLFF